MNHLLLIIGVVIGVLVLTPVVLNVFLVDVLAGEIRFVRRSNGKTRVYRGPCKILRLPLVGTHWRIPDMPIQVQLEVSGPRASSPEMVRAKAIVRVVSEEDAMVEAAVDRFFSMPPVEQLQTLQELLSSAATRAMEAGSRDSFGRDLERYAAGALRDFGLCFVEVTLTPSASEEGAPEAAAAKP